MTTVLGLIGMALWIVAVVGLAAGVTYAVVKLFPSEDEKAAKSADTTSEASG
jgi:hypothetical protein